MFFKSAGDVPEMATKIYLAGPLFCEAELDFNEKLAGRLRGHGFEVLLPQELGIDVRSIIAAYDNDAYVPIFESDLDALKSCDVLVMVMDGRVPDEGACVELGIAFGAGMECFGFKTDIRTSEYGTDNFMITGALKGRVANDAESLRDMINSVIGTSNG
jgi:nucleoside 2-deoxyribosyltransferase